MAQSHDLQAILDRLDALDAQSRRWRVFAVVSFVVMVGTLVLTARTRSLREEVRSQRFVLVNKENQERGVLAEVESNVNGLILQDSTGKKRFSVLVRDDGSSAFSLSDREERTLVGVAVDGNGSPKISLTDHSGRGVKLGTEPEGVTVLELRGKEDVPATPKAILKLGPNNEPTFHLFDNKGKVRAAVTSGDALRPPASKLTDAAGVTLFQAPGPAAPAP